MALKREVAEELHALYLSRSRAKRMLIEEDEDGCESDEDGPTLLHRSINDERNIQTVGGITLQKCGGGHRIVRRGRRNY